MRGTFEPKLRAQLEEYGVSYEYEPYKIPYTIEAKYVPDFVLSNGVHIEGKGYLDQDTRRKLRAVKRCNPDLDLRIVFQNASVPLSKRNRSTHGEWADRYGFKWADKVIPREWTE